MIALNTNSNWKLNSRGHFYSSFRKTLIASRNNTGIKQDISKKAI